MIVKAETRFRCDFCGQPAALAASVRREEIRNLCMCKPCAEALYGELAKHIVPKSPKSIIKARAERDERGT